MDRTSAFDVWKVWVALFVLMGGGVVSVEAQYGGSTPVDRETYVSASGRYGVTVEPSEIHGAGGARYLFHENKKEVGAVSHPFTLRKVVVTDQGQVAGYGYTAGPEGFFGGGKRYGDFVVAIIGRDGKVQFQENVTREGSQFLHFPPDPMAKGLVLDEENDRVIVRVKDPDVNRGSESWWVYRLSTAKLIEKFMPKSRMSETEPTHFIMQVRPVPQSLLLIVQWWQRDYDHPAMKSGSRFTLVDLKGNPVWDLKLPGDYTIAKNEKAEEALWELVKEGVILPNAHAGQFDLWFAKEKQRVTFAASAGKDGAWTVKEVGRVPYVLQAKEEEKPVPIPTVALKGAGTIALQIPAITPPAPIREVRSFVFDGEGQIAFLREEDQTATFVHVDASGKLLKEIPLKLEVAEDSRWSGCVWVGGTTFVVTNSEHGDDKRSRAWWVDVKTGMVRQIPDFDAPYVDRLIGFPDGGFVVMKTHGSLLAFDKSGKQIWNQATDYNRKGPDVLFSLTDIAATTRDEIVVLDNIRKTLQFFDRKGDFLRKIDLKKSFGEDGVYLSRIGAGPDGGSIVEDFGQHVAFYRLAADGKLLGKMFLKEANGRVVSPKNGVQASPDGTLWTCDGNCLLRVSEAGLVNRILGQAPQYGALERIAGITVDAKGGISAVDSRTGSIHVFDSSGQFRHVCALKPTDAWDEGWDVGLTVGETGEMFLRIGDNLVGPNERRTYAHFNAAGARLKDESFASEKVLLQPKTGNFICQSWEEVVLSDSGRKVLKTIRHRPDGRWLAEVEDLVTAPDGSFVILTEARFSSSGRSPGEVNLYQANGEPVRAIRLPESIGLYPRCAYDGRWLVLAGENGVTIFDLRGDRVQQCPYPIPTNVKYRYVSPYLLEGGKKLALFDGKTPVLHVFEMP